MTRLSIGGLLLLLLASACTTGLAPEPTPDFRPETRPPAGMIEPLGPILLLRAYSGTFVAHEDRTIAGFPEIVVFDDGRVVASTSPDLAVGAKPAYRSVTLTPDELEVLVDQLQAADLREIAIGGIANGSFCDDCGTTIIRSDVSGETVEIAAFGLFTEGRASYVSRLPYPDELIALDRALNALRERVTAEGEPADEHVPQVPIAPAGGG